MENPRSEEEKTIKDIKRYKDIILKIFLRMKKKIITNQ